MATIRFEGGSVSLREGETALEGLLRSGADIPHSCRAGACQSCLLRATKGAPPAAAQVGLSEPLKAQGYFLACLAEPESDLEVDRGGEGLQQVAARIAAIEPLSPTVLRILLDPEGPFEYRPGQFLTLIREDGLARSYSIASHPDGDSLLELHVRVLPEGRMSGWLAEGAAPGDRVTLRGPSGNCFYLPGQADQELVLAGTGTGLAPLYGILRDAHHHGHTGPITLFHGALSPRGLYLGEELRDWERKLPGFRYVPCCLEGEEGRDDVEVGPLDRAIFGRFPKLGGRRVFLCGDPKMVNALRKAAFLAGAGWKEIAADAFLMAPAKAG